MDARPNSEVNESTKKHQQKELSMEIAGFTEYCTKKYRCGNEDHTVCKLYPCGPSSVCGDHFQGYGTNAEDIKLILKIHNEYRNKIALGEESIAGVSKTAANMNEMVYDNQLSMIAQCWANYCLKDGISNAHDSCRKTMNFAYVGQNMFGITIAGRKDLNDPIFIKNAIESWYKEIQDMQYNIVESFYDFGGNNSIGHFTQMIWAETSRVGCGRTEYGTGKFHSLIVYCNYGPGGNILNMPVFKKGEPCSQCETQMCSTTYKGLCEPPYYKSDAFYLDKSRSTTNRKTWQVWIRISITFAVMISTREGFTIAYFIIVPFI